MILSRNNESLLTFTLSRIKHFHGENRAINPEKLLKNRHQLFLSNFQNVIKINYWYGL